ncbi:MAG: DNA-binding transcriptional LysR family regulator [Porticoccaceae bacterium]|jgi:DNA-binding transcriptional LysR family regulator
MKHLTTFRLIDAIERTGSIRSAAELVSQTPSAVQRRLQSYEQELGFAIFDRTTKGVCLSAAGELVLHHVRETLAESERLTSRIADLAGVRRGSVSIGCSQALLPYFLPQEIAQYQAEFPNVTFDVQVIEHERAAEMLEAFEVDFVLVFNGQSVPDYDVRLAVPQNITAVMAENHPLKHHETVRLRQCYEYPIALATKGFGSRSLLDRALFSKTYATAPTLQSNSFEFLKGHVASTKAITFQIQIGAPEELEGTGIISRPIDPRDVVGGYLTLGQKRNRTLSVAASRFVEQIIKPLSERFDLDVKR